MKIKFKRVRYSDLNAKQKENYNFQMISAVLAEFGYSTIRLTDDWNGADFIAQHADGKTVLRVQLKPRLHFSKTYSKKNLWLCFREKENVYLLLHDEIVRKVLRKKPRIQHTESWRIRGRYSFKYHPVWLKDLLAEYCLTS